MRKDSGIELLLLLAQPDLVTRQSDEGAFEHQAPARLFGPKRNQKGRRRKSWRDLQPKALATDPLQIGVLHMKGAQYALDLVGKCDSLALRQRMAHRQALDEFGRGKHERVLQFRLGQGPVACKDVKIDKKWRNIQQCRKRFASWDRDAAFKKLAAGESAACAGAPADPGAVLHRSCAGLKRRAV